MKLTNYRPHPKLITKKTIVNKPRFPVVDAHNHLGEAYGGGWDKKPLPELLDILDEANITHYIDLDGGFGEDLLNHHLDYFKAKAPERFSIFGGVDFSEWERQGTGFGKWAARKLKAQASRGAEGLKIWKNFGLHVQDHEGNLAKVDDPHLSPIWDVAGELNLPVIIHIADPVAFFDPIDEKNERWEELGAHPDWAFPSPPFPAFMSIMDDFANLVARHPETTFIGAHVGCYAENLAWVSDLLDRCPNFYVDISARVGELGRQPYTSRRFFTRYADRILFGSDMGPDLDAYRIYYRFLETDDEYFNYSVGEIPSQGRWQIYGLFLPDDILKKVYAENAQRIFKLE